MTRVTQRRGRDAVVQGHSSPPSRSPTSPPTSSRRPAATRTADPHRPTSRATSASSRPTSTARSSGRTASCSRARSRRCAATRAAGLHVIVVTGRMVQSVRRRLEPAGLDEPVICYQGAVVADADGNVAPSRADPARARARGDRVRSQREGYAPNVYVDDELYVSGRRRRRARDYAGFQNLDDPRRSATCSTGSASRRRSSCCVGDPDALDGVEAG